MFTPRKSAAAFRAAMLVTCSVAIGACTLNTDTSAPSAMVRITGVGQTSPPNTALPEAFGVMVVNQFGEPLSGVTVTWSIISGGGTLSADSSLSDDTGAASVIYTTGPTAGTGIVQANVHGLPPLRFSVTITSS
jgi:hypothetical protein